VEGADALGLVAEVGIAIAGFAGVIAVLRAPDGRISPYAMFRIGWLLFQSGGAVLLALLPFAFHQAGLSAVAIWRLSSGVMLVLVALISVGPFTFAARLLPPPETEAYAPGVGIIVPIQYAVMITNILLQAANVALIGQLWPFYVGLLATTALSLLQFGWLLFATSRAELQP
jgi:hypothetical protein